MRVKDATLGRGARKGRESVPCLHEFPVALEVVRHIQKAALEVVNSALEVVCLSKLALEV
jgi:hypothetical protein